MKLSKPLSVLLSIVLIFSLSSCGGSSGASEKAISVAKNAVKIADSYLDGEYGYDTVKTKLEELSYQMEYVSDLTTEDTNKSADFSIKTKIVILQSNILFDDIDQTADSYDKVIETRNELAAAAGLKKR